jgi:hypothetical protein
VGPDQLTPVGDVMGRALDDEDMREIDRIVADTIKDPVPEFMAPPPRRSIEAASNEQIW